MWWDPKTGHALFRVGLKKDLFSSSRPISDSIASSLSIFTVRARQQPPNALVIFCICCPCVAPSYLASMERQSFLVCDGIQTLDMLSIGLGSKKDRSAPVGQSATHVLRVWAFYCPCKTATTKCVGGIVASIAAFKQLTRVWFPANAFHWARAEVNAELFLWHLVKLLDESFDSRNN